MKLKNKKTGEIVIADITHMVSGVRFDCGQSLAELNEEWEDVPEEKNFWHINEQGNIYKYPINLIDRKGIIRRYEEIGNYFGTKEEAEKTVEKLKAWKRLRDKGFRFTAWKNGILLDKTVAGQVRYEFPIDNKEDIEKDLDLLFSGEDD